MTAKNSFYQKV